MKTEKLLLVITLGLLLLASCSPAILPVAHASIIYRRNAMLQHRIVFPARQLYSSCRQITGNADPYYNWSNEYLRSRSYGGGQIEFVEVIEHMPVFTRYLIRYPSDGLNIYGFADIPNDEEIHPVIIALHGYIDPAAYNTLDYTTRYADALAGTGYIVLHPNLRGYPPSDQGEISSA